MGFRFRKSFKAGPFRWTVSKSGISTSVGVKGYRVTKTARGGLRRTVSIPGTGISYVNEEKPKERQNTVKNTGTSRMNSRSPRKKKPLLKRWWFWALVVFIGFGALGGALDSAEPSEPSASVVDLATPEPSDELLMLTEPSPETDDVQRLLPEEAEPTPEPTPTPTPEYTYILNTNTHKFHKPSCSSVGDIKDGNKQEFTGTRDAVIAMGYEPCARCHP